MPIGKITRNRQVTIPKDLFDKLNLREGDYIEFTQEGNQIVLEPKDVVDREREETKRELGKLLEKIWKRNKDVDPKLVEREVEKAIKEAQKAKRTQKS